MAVLEVKAYAKLNLSLDVLGKRPDGYHDMRMVMQTVSLSDDIRLETGTGRPLRMESNLGFLPANESNLAAAAALRLCEAAGADAGGLSIDLEKTIPVCAGLAGGSADAAAVLRGMNKLLGLGLPGERLEEIGALVGSDVPYCVRGGTALAEGRGECLTDLPPLPNCFLVVCKPPFPISTPQLFGRVNVKKITCRPDTQGLVKALEAGDLQGVARRLYNVFEDVLEPRHRQTVDEIKSTLIEYGALGAVMSGSGPTVFGLYQDEGTARKAAQVLGEQYKDVFVCQPV